MPITIRRFRVGSAQIEDDAIGSWHIADNAVVSAAIKDGAVGSAKLGADSVYGDKVADAGIGTVKLAADSVYGDKISDAGVGSAKLSADSVYGDKIADDGIGSSILIADNVIGHDQMLDSAIGYTELTTGLQGSFGVPNANSVGTTELKEPAVGSSQIYDDAIGSQHIDDDAIGSSIMIADNVIGNEHMRDAAIGYTELTAGLQGSFVGVKEYPYMGDDSEVTVTGTTPGTIKTATILKDSYALDLGSIKIAAELKASHGSYDMEVLLGTEHKLSFTGTETAYKIHTGSIGLGGESDGALPLQFTLKNSGTGSVSYNKLVDIIAVM